MELEPLSTERQAELAEKAENWDGELFGAGSKYAEQAFGLGCAIGLLPGLGVVFLLWVFGAINFIMTVMLAIVVLLALAGVAGMLAFRARSNAIRRVYSETVAPQIAQYLSQYGMSRSEFDTRVFAMLAESAPLQTFLAPVLAEESEEDAVGYLQ